MLYLGVVALGLLPLVFGSAYAQVTDELAGPAGLPAIIPEDDSVGPVATVDELLSAHSDLTDIMLRQSIGDFGTPDLPFVMTYVDEDSGDLVVVMNAIAAIVGITYEEEEVQAALGHDVPIKILYGAVVLDRGPSRAQQLTSFYNENCVPITPGKVDLCRTYASHLRAQGVSVPGQPPPPISKTLSTRNPCDLGTSHAFTCHHYERYQTICISSPSDYRCANHKSRILSAGFALPTAAGSPAPTGERNPTDVRARLSGGAITVTWDAPDYDTRHYRVETYKDGGSDGRNYVTGTTFRTSDIDEGSTYKFSVKAYYTGSVGGSSSSGTITSNNVYVPDKTSPVIQVPDTIRKTTTDSGGTRVNYSVSASDNIDSSVSVSCNHSSNSVFGVGLTRVSCTAADRAGNGAAKQFYVIITYREVDSEPPKITVPEPITRSTKNPAGLVIQYQASAHDDVDGNIAPDCNPPSGSKFKIGETTVTCTANDTAGKQSTRRFSVTVEREPDGVFYGGDSYLHLVDTGDNREYKSGTITIGATNSDNVDGMVVSGHVASPDPGETFISHNAGPPSAPVQVYGREVTSYENDTVDTAFIPLTGSNVVVHDKIRTNDGSTFDVSYGRLADVQRIQPIHMYGYYTNSHGILAYKDATVRSPGHGTFVEMGIGTYASVGGDSGSPVIHHGDEARIIGLHVGAVCSFEVHGRTIDISDVRLNGARICDLGNNIRYFTMFSDWENVVDVLDLQ